jgi:O-antigen ligase
MVLTLLFSMSATSILVYLASLSFLMISPFLRQKNPLAIYLSLTFVFGSILFVAGRLEAIASLFGKDLTLTGRVDAIWPLLMEAISERPYFGYGYAAFWQSWLGSQDPSNSYAPIYQQSLDSAHNGFLELGLDFGLAGILVFLLLALKYINISFKTFIRGRDYKSIFPISLLIFQLMSNATESSLVSINAISIYWLILIFILAQDFKNKKLLENAYSPFQPSTLRRRSLDYSSRRHRAFSKHDDSRSTSASEY